MKLKKCTSFLLCVILCFFYYFATGQNNMNFSIADGGQLSIIDATDSIPILIINEKSEVHTSIVVLSLEIDSIFKPINAVTLKSPNITFWGEINTSLNTITPIFISGSENNNPVVQILQSMLQNIIIQWHFAFYENDLQNILDGAPITGQIQCLIMY